VVLAVPPASTAKTTTTPLTGLRNLQLRLDGNFNVRSNCFCFSISGASNTIAVVEACTNLTHPVWFPVSVQNLISGSAAFADAGWTNYPALYYRVRAP